METKLYNSKLRALVSVRNFNKALDNHYEQMKQIEENFDELNENALSIIEVHCSREDQDKWKNSQKDVSDSISSINKVLKLLQEKIVKKDRTNSLELWKQFSVHENKLKESYKFSERLGFEILPENEHKHWQKDICVFEDTILSLIISHADACKLELEMIEKYTPKELNKITQVVLDHIPDEFTFEEADKYEEDYLIAVEDMKKEFKSEKNLWDKFLDILAGGTHQPPSERVMMKRWLDGEKEDEL